MRVAVHDTDDLVAGGLGRALGAQVVERVDGVDTRRPGGVAAPVERDGRVAAVGAGEQAAGLVRVVLHGVRNDVVDDRLGQLQHAPESIHGGSRR